MASSIGIQNGDGGNVAYNYGNISMQRNPRGAKAEKLTFPNADGFLIKYNGRAYSTISVKFNVGAGNAAGVNTALASLATVLSAMQGRASDKISIIYPDGTNTIITHLLYNNDATAGRMLSRGGNRVSAVTCSFEVVGE